MGTLNRVLELTGSGVQGMLLWMLLWMFLVMLLSVLLPVRDAGATTSHCTVALKGVAHASKTMNSNLLPEILKLFCRALSATIARVRRKIGTL